MVTHPDLDLYVTWAALEENLKGIRESLDSALQSPKLIGGKDDSGKEKTFSNSLSSPKDNEQRFTQTVKNCYFFCSKNCFFFI